MSETMTLTEKQPAKAEAFPERFLTALNHGALCLMVSIGHRTGLFDVLSKLPPATPTEIAAEAGLNERYVREWLGAMTTAGVVEVDPAGTRFTLPAEHAAFLTRAAAADNIAVFAQYIAAARRRGGRDRRVLPEGRRRALRTLPSLPCRHGGGQRAVRALVARIAHPAARARVDRPARHGDPRARCRLRQRPDHEPAGRTRTRTAGSSAWIFRRKRSAQARAEARTQGAAEHRVRSGAI